MVFSINSALLDACILSVLATGDTYGYALTQRMKSVVDLSESTLYPVLRRLQKAGHLETYNELFQGRNRRMYKITEQGNQALEIYRSQWGDYKAQVDSILLGGANNEQE